MATPPTSTSSDCKMDPKPVQGIIKKQKGKKNLKVRWHSSVIENEGKGPLQKREKLKPWVGLYPKRAFPEPPPTEEDDYDHRLFSTEYIDHPWESPDKFLEWKDAQTKGATYTPGSPMMTDNPQELRHYRPPTPANIGMKRVAGMASSAPARAVKKTSPKKAKVPPAVPDAPEVRRGPPPTPRIPRLATPDILEVESDSFCSCDDSHSSKLDS